MKNRYFVSLLVLTLFAFSLVSAAGLNLPSQFYGDAIYNGAPANGLVVDAYMEGVKVGSTTVVNGVYGGGNSTLLLIKDSDGFSSGKVVIFFLNGVDTGQTAIYDNGAIVKIDLSATGSVDSGNDGGGSSGGGGGGSSSTTSSNVDDGVPLLVENGSVVMDVDGLPVSADGSALNEGFSSSGITGAAIGGAGSWIAALVLVGVVLILFVVVRKRRGEAVAVGVASKKKGKVKK